MSVTLRRFDVVAPRADDPRLHIAAVVVTLHMLGQTLLDFDQSIAQILVCVGTAAGIGFIVGLVRDRIVAWPASAAVAGNGVAFIMRIPGTRHGDWWSMRGWWIYVIAVGVALASKEVFTYRGAHVFNPANLGLVTAFLVLGSTRTDPLLFWWGPLGAPTITAWAVILVGGIALIVRVRRVALAAAFWVSFAAALGLVAVNDHCIVAAWHLGSLCGSDFWASVVGSPEIAVFTLLMISDPRTTPHGWRAQLWFGSTIGLVAAAAAAPQRTEFATKVAVLGALTITCAIWTGLKIWRERRATAISEPRVRLAWAGSTLALALLAFAAAPTRTVEPGRLAGRLATQRPTVDDLEVPMVTANPSDRVAAALDPADLDRIGRDVAEDVRIVDLAREQGDLDLLETATAEAELARQQREMRKGRASRGRSQLDRIVISVARREGQAAPALMATVRGERDGERFVDTFEIKRLDGHYVLSTRDLPPGFVPPITLSRS